MEIILKNHKVSVQKLTRIMMFQLAKASRLNRIFLSITDDIEIVNAMIVYFHRYSKC